VLIIIILVVGILLLVLRLLDFALSESTALICFFLGPADSADLLLAMTPIVTYMNSDLDKLDILKDNKGKSGIYL